jgi:N-acyl homoserine lactone hydrolase
MSSRKLALLPRIDVLALSRLVSLPESHPEHTTFEPFPVYGFLIHHTDGPIVVDTGIGFDNAFIDALYGHESVDLVAEINRCGVDERDVACIVNSHLHFDHCGQNHKLSAPIVVQQAEVLAAAEEFYTVPEWASIPPERSRIVDGDSEIASGVSVLLTPGHTPGHQAVVVRSTNGVVVIAAQCLFRSSAWNELADGVEPKNLHDETWHSAAAESIERLRSLKPDRVLLSHDVAITAGLVSIRPHD